MTPRREMVATLVALAASSALLLLAVGRTWVRTAAEPSRLEAARSLSGSGLEPGLTALGVVGLAGVVAVLATRGPLRLVVGAVIVLAGTGAAALAATAAPAGASSVSGWRVVAVLAAVLIAGSGLLTCVRGRRWPSMSARYDAPGGASAATEAEGGAAEDRSDRAMWDAVERGEDPTA